MTGRAAGYCAGFPVPGYMNLLPGRGWGFGRGGGGGRGRGRGWGRWFGGPGLVGPAYYGWPATYAQWPAVSPPSPEQETQALQAQARHFEDALDNIRKRLAELQASQESEG